MEALFGEYKLLFGYFELSEEASVGEKSATLVECV
jgi:hypothetical protein